MRLEFCVPGQPMALKRHRMTSAGGFARAYDPAANKSKKAEIAWLATQAWRDTKQHFDGPVRLIVVAYMERPKSVSKKRLFPVVKPDLDNIVKMIKDALTKVVWRDDSQVCSLSAHKRYCDPYTLPFTRVVITDMWPHEIEVITEEGGF